MVRPRDPRPRGPDPSWGRDALPPPRLRRRAAHDRRLSPVLVPTDPAGRRGHCPHCHARPDHRGADGTRPVGDGTDAARQRGRGCRARPWRWGDLADGRPVHADCRDHVVGTATARLLGHARRRASAGDQVRRPKGRPGRLHHARGQGDRRLRRLDDGWQRPRARLLLPRHPDGREVQPALVRRPCCDQGARGGQPSRRGPGLRHQRWRRGGGVTAAVDALGPDRMVVLVNLMGPFARIDDDNATLEAVAASRPNVIVADWAAAVRDHPEQLQSDRIHPSLKGSHLFSKTVRQALATLSERHTGTEGRPQGPPDALTSSPTRSRASAGTGKFGVSRMPNHVAPSHLRCRASVRIGSLPVRRVSRSIVVMTQRSQTIVRGRPRPRCGPRPSRPRRTARCRRRRRWAGSDRGRWVRATHHARCRRAPVVEAAKGGARTSRRIGAASAREFVSPSCPPRSRPDGTERRVVLPHQPQLGARPAPRSTRAASGSAGRAVSCPLWSTATGVASRGAATTMRAACPVAQPDRALGTGLLERLGAQAEQRLAPREP